MACERCGAQTASDGSIIDAAFAAPNGRTLHLVARVSASHDATGLHAAMFCKDCWLWFLEQFGHRLAQKRILREPAATA